MKILFLSIITILTVVVLFPFNVISAQNESKPQLNFDHANYFTEKMSCYYYETGKMISQGQAPTKATVIVTDSSANKFSNAIDQVSVQVWSDTDKKGIELTAYETDVNSGIFKGTVTISEGQSTQGIIHVSEGDTLWARYAGTTPWSPGTTGIGITTTAFIGALCPPLERVPASGIDFTDNEGRELKNILAGKQLQIGSMLSNPTIRDQNFTYIVQINVKDKNPESVSWVSGLLHPSQTFSPRVSWTPLKAGDYTVQVFVWQSINNPNSLSPPLFTDFTVWPSLPFYKSFTTGNVENLHCQPGYELVIKSSNNSTVCVAPDTAQKLIERGWGHALDNGQVLYFMKLNSTGKLIVKYTSTGSYGSTYVNPKFFNGTTMQRVSPALIEVEANQGTITNDSNTITYMIKSHGSKGVYWLSLDTCSFVPIVLGLDISKITNSDLQFYFSGLRCPVSFLQYKIVGFDGIDPE